MRVSQSRVRPLALATVLLAGVASPALAQTTEEKIAAMEARIAELSAQVAELKAATAAQAKPAPAPAPTPAVQAASISNARPTIASADGAQKFAVRTVVQMDAAAYDEQGTVDLNSGTNFRRVRLGVEGAFAKDWAYNLTADFGGSGVESAQLNAAYIEYGGFKPFGLTSPLRLRIGAWATPTGLEDATSNTESLFLERAAAAELVRNLAGGDARSGLGAFANGEHWYASGVLTGGVANTSGTYDEQYGYLTRAAFNPLYGKDYSLHLGASVQGIFQPADTAAGAATLTQVQLRERPELRVDGTRLVDTGLIDADGLTAYGLELGFHWKNVQFASEAFQIDVDRLGGADPSFDGWYAHLAYALTGEQHVWNAQNGGYRGLRPKAAFDPAKGAWGAWEVVGRYSLLDLNDNAGLAGAATPAGGIRGGEQTVTDLGLNWYPNNVFRFLLHYQWIDIERLNSAGAEIGEDVEAVSLRSQFSF